MIVVTGGGRHLAFLLGMSELTGGGAPEAAALAAHAERHGVRLLPAS